MNKSMLAVLNTSERLLVAETERAALDLLDEEGVLELHTRIRRARNKYSGLYRRGASARVVKQGARGAARPKNTNAALKAEVFEEALARVSKRLAILANKAAKELKAERLEAASEAKSGNSGANRASNRSSRRSRATKSAPKGPRTADAPTGNRALRSPAREKKRASTQAAGARRQAKRDSR